MYAGPSAKVLPSRKACPLPSSGQTCPKRLRIWREINPPMKLELCPRSDSQNPQALFLEAEALLSATL